MAHSIELLRIHRIHLIGIACFGVLLWCWRTGRLTELSFWILGIDCLINLGIWALLGHGFDTWRADPNRQRLEELAAETQFLSEKKRSRRAA